MYNLSDLENTIKSLIRQLRDIEQSLKQPVSRTRNNQCKILIKIPTFILLAQISPFLTMQQINNLSNVSKVLRRKIYSPIGWKIISILKTPYPKIIIQKEQQSFLKRKDNQFHQHHFQDDFDEDEKRIAQEQETFSKILRKKYESYEKSKEKYEALCEKVRIQKSHIFRMKEQYRYFEQIKDELEEENKNYKDRLRKLSAGFSKRIQEMDKQIQILNKQRAKLQSQKEALAGKIREYQHEIQIIREDSEKQKQILKRLKNYLLYKEL